MEPPISKGELEIILSHLAQFKKPRILSEQYATPSSIAADWLFNAFMLSDITNEVYDFGSGTGILGIGALLLGAKKVFFIESDKDAIKILNKNLSNLKIPSRKYKIINIDLLSSKLVPNSNSMVIQNPPFGTKKIHLDRDFLKKAMESGFKVIYSMHKYSTLNFLYKFTELNDYLITHKFIYDFQIKHQHFFHTKPTKKIKVVVIRLEKSQNAINKDKNTKLYKQNLISS